MNTPEITAIVESILFVAGTPVSLRRLAEIIGVAQAEVKPAMGQLMAEYATLEISTSQISDWLEISHESSSGAALEWGAFGGSRRWVPIPHRRREYGIHQKVRSGETQ